MKKKKITELAPNPKNPRKISDEQKARLKKAFFEFGDLSGVIFNRKSQMLVGGHQRTGVMPEDSSVTYTKEYKTPTRTGTVAEGYIEIEGERYNYREVEWDEAREKTANIAANKHGGQFDISLLNDWILELDGLNTDMDLIGFSAEELANLMAPITKIAANGDTGSVPAEPKKIKVSKGDLFELGDSRVLCGDSTVLTDVDRLMGGEKADCVWTDPPYNVAYEGKTKESLKISNDEMDDQKFFDFLKTTYSNMLMHTKAGGAIYVAHASMESANFITAMKEAGWSFRSILIWVKQTLVMGRGDYHWKHEPILYGWAPGKSHNWYSDRKQTTVLEFDRPQRNEDHPTMKPTDLIEYMLGNSCCPGGRVLDLFGGSGSTLIAAVNSGRVANLCEFEPRYAHVIIQRWVEFTGLEAYRLEEDGSKTPWSEIRAR